MGKQTGKRVPVLICSDCPDQHLPLRRVGRLALTRLGISLLAAVAPEGCSASGDANDVLLWQILETWQGLLHNQDNSMGWLAWIIAW